MSPSLDTTLIFDLDRTSLEAQIAAMGEPRYRADQVWRGIYRQLYTSADVITTLPPELRSRLDRMYRFSSLTIQQQQRSQKDDTEKYLFSLYDGARIESVLMPYQRRRTACISTQSGCALGCLFCATGRMGLIRNLTSGEIIEQVIVIARKLADQDDRLTHIVFMGMGEPFHNYGATMQAIEVLNDADGLNFGARRMTISTVGLVPMIDRFSHERFQINLAVSLHAATDEVRSAIMPVNQKYPLAEVIAACRRYVNRTRRRISFEWAMIQGLNDTIEQASAFVQLVKGLNCHLNIIPLNATRGYSGQAAADDVVRAFQTRVQSAGISCTIRVPRGIDIDAGCGQLATSPGSQTSTAA